MASISSAGIGTGLDINSIVSQLVAAERAPVKSRLDTKEANLQAELSAFGTLKSSLSTFQDALKGLTDLKAGRTAGSSDGDILGVSADDGAALGTYGISVSQLASAQSLASESFPDSTSALGTGTLTLQVGSGDAATITIDSTNNSLEGIAAAINEADAGVSATIVNDGSGDRLVLNSLDTGAANTISLTVADDDGNDTDASGLSAIASANLTETVAAEDAHFTVNGIAITSASNDNDSAIQGLTLNLEDVSSGTPVTVTVDADKAAVTGALQTLVDAYNKFNDLAKQLTAYDPNTRQAGILLGDSTLRTVAVSLQNALISTVAGAPANYDNLVDIGITTDSNGKMQLDGDALNKALDSDFGAVVGTLNQAASGLDDTVGSLVQSGGLFDSRTGSIQDQLDDIGDQRTDLDNRMTQLQQTLMAQYTAMDTLVAQLQSTSNYLTQQLANLPKPDALQGSR